MKEVRTMEVCYMENQLSVADYTRIRVTVGAYARPDYQVEKALRNGLYNVSAIVDGQTVGLGRLVGDGALYWYIQDVAVLPEYQGRGIGKEIVRRLVEYARNNSLPGTLVTLGLMAAKGRESFYTPFGFKVRSVSETGAGMDFMFTAPGQAGEDTTDENKDH